MSVPQTAPALGQPAPLRRKFSGHDEKVDNLMKQFPTVPEEKVRQELHNVGGHASKARNAIQKKYMASTPPPTPSGGANPSPAASMNSSPEPVSKEPPAPAPVSPANGQAAQPRAPAPPGSSPAVMEQATKPPSAKSIAPKAKASKPATGAKGEAIDNLKSRFPDQDHAAVQSALKQAGGHAGKAATILSKGGAVAKEPADIGKVDGFLAGLSKSELKRVVADAEKKLGVEPQAAAPASSKTRSVAKKDQGASCFKMFTHICAADGAKGAKAQAKSDAMGR